MCQAPQEIQSVKFAKLARIIPQMDKAPISTQFAYRVRQEPPPPPIPCNAVIVQPEPTLAGALRVSHAGLATTRSQTARNPARRVRQETIRLRPQRRAKDTLLSGVLAVNLNA